MPEADRGTDRLDDEIRWSALMGSAQSGCEADYRQLLQELSSAIKHYLLSRIGQHHSLDDCIQESLIAIHHARHTYDPGRRFRPWLFAIVRRKSIDMFRRQRSQLQLQERHRQELHVSAQDSPISELENHVTQGRLMKALPAHQREVLALTKFVGLSNAETARYLRISESAVKVRVHRAINALKRLMEVDAR